MFDVYTSLVTRSFVRIVLSFRRGIVRSALRKIPSGTCTPAKSVIRFIVVEDSVLPLAACFNFLRLFGATFHDFRIEGQSLLNMFTVVTP